MPYSARIGTRNAAVLQRSEHPIHDRTQTWAPLEHTFVSRESELAHLDRLLQKTVAGKGQICFVTGEAGFGKTCLTTEFAHRAQHANDELLVAIGDCNSQTGIGDPYLPFREVLGMLTGDVDDRVAQGMTTEENASRLRSLFKVSKKIVMEVGPDLIDIFVPGVGLATKAGVMVAGDNDTLWRKRGGAATGVGAASPVQPVQESEQGRIFEQVTRVLLTLSAQRPLILILDDLHWVDDSSASLLFHLARRIEGSRIMVIGTYRPEEVALGRGRFRHPMAQIIPELKRHYGDCVIQLGEEDEDEARRFVDAFIDSEANSLDRDFRQGLFERTRGHPLFTVELLRDMQDRGVLQRNDEGEWAPGPELDWDALPARTEGVIEERINRLADDLQEILTVASVQGEEFVAQAIRPMTDINERQLLAVLSQELGRVHRLVVEDRTERVAGTRLSYFRFRHQMFQQYFYGRLGSSERELLHENTADALESIYGDRRDQIALPLALHFRRAGLDQKAAAYFLHAGRRACDVYAYNEAAAHANRGIDCLQRADLLKSESDLLLELMLLKGEAQQRGGHVNESMDTYRATAERALRLGAPEAAARAAMGYSEPCWRYNMVDETSVTLVSRALALLKREDSALRACLIAYLARISEKLKSTTELLSMLDEAMTMARRIDDPGTLIDCARFRFSLDRDPDRIGQRLELADEMVELSSRVDNKALLLELLMFRIYDQLAVGNLDCCERDVDTIQELAKKLGDPFYIYQGETMRISGAILTGRFSEAERLALDAMDTGKRLGVDNVEGVMGVQMFTIRREQGRLGEIAPLVSHFVEERGAGAAWRPGLALAYAEIGDLENAKAQFERMAGTEFKCVPKDALWQTCLSYLTEVCDRLDDMDRARILYDLLSPYVEQTLVVGNAIACLGAASRFVGQLASVMEHWDQAEAHFEHAMDFNRKLNARPWLAHTQYQHARMLLQRGLDQDAARADRLFDAAKETARTLGMRGLAEKINLEFSDG